MPQVWTLFPLQVPGPGRGGKQPKFRIRLQTRSPGLAVFPPDKAEVVSHLRHLSHVVARREPARTLIKDRVCITHQEFGAGAWLTQSWRKLYADKAQTGCHRGQRCYSHQRRSHGLPGHGGARGMEITYTTWPTGQGEEAQSVWEKKLHLYLVASGRSQDTI